MLRFFFWLILIHTDGTINCHANQKVVGSIPGAGPFLCLFVCVGFLTFEKRRAVLTRNSGDKSIMYRYRFPTTAERPCSNNPQVDIHLLVYFQALQHFPTY